VDDEQTLVEAIAQSLQAEGYQVSVAFDGYTAGVKMATVQPDLLVLDLIMPGVDGFSVCKRVKADPATRRTKILAMTGFVQEGNVAKALECGADLCLEKPFRVESLKTSVARLLGQRKGAPSGALGIERRRLLRVAAEIPVICTPLSGGSTAAGAFQAGRSINLSREGMRLALAGPLALFSPIALEILLPESREPVHALGEGRWVKPAQGTQEQEIGIEFIAIQAQQRKRLIKRLYSS
jgi:DNA-binding response OmpR family regulator